MAPQIAVSNFFELYVRGLIYCFFNKFLILLGNRSRSESMRGLSTEITTVEYGTLEPSVFRTSVKTQWVVDQL